MGIHRGAAQQASGYDAGRQRMAEADAVQLPRGEILAAKGKAHIQRAGHQSHAGNCQGARGKLDRRTKIRYIT